MDSLSKYFNDEDLENKRNAKYDTNEYNKQ